MGKDSVEVSRLAKEVAKAVERLVRALEAETTLKRKPGDVKRGEVRNVRQAVDESAEGYLKTIRQYVGFLERSLWARSDRVVCGYTYRRQVGRPIKSAWPR